MYAFIDLLLHFGCKEEAIRGSDWADHEARPARVGVSDTRSSNLQATFDKEANLPFPAAVHCSACNGHHMGICIANNYTCTFTRAYKP